MLLVIAIDFWTTRHRLGATSVRCASEARRDGPRPTHVISSNAILASSPVQAPRPKSVINTHKTLSHRGSFTSDYGIQSAVNERHTWVNSFLRKPQNTLQGKNKSIYFLLVFTISMGFKNKSSWFRAEPTFHLADGLCYTCFRLNSCTGVCTFACRKCKYSGLFWF